MIEKGTKAPFTGALMPSDMVRSYEEMALEKDILQQNLDTFVMDLKEQEKCMPSDPLRPLYFFGLGAGVMGLLLGLTAL